MGWKDTAVRGGLLEGSFRIPARARAPTREPLVVLAPRAFDLVNLARTAGSHGEPHAARASAGGDLGVRAPAVTPSPRVVILRDSSPPIL